MRGAALNWASVARAQKCKSHLVSAGMLKVATRILPSARLSLARQPFDSIESRKYLLAPIKL